jgi:hypothetical protein
VAQSALIADSDRTLSEDPTVPLARKAGGAYIFCSAYGTRNTNRVGVPSFAPMAWPTLQAFRYFGSSGTVGEMRFKVWEGLQLSEHVLPRVHGKGLETEFANLAP